MRKFLLIAALLALPVFAREAAPATDEVQVMILGTLHMANPGGHIHDDTIDDVLAPKRQKELKEVADALLRFAPTRVMVEQSPGSTTVPYRKYREGMLEPARNEAVQLGFRLAAMAGLDEVHGIDADGDFPYPALVEYVNRTGRQAMLQELDDETARLVAESQRVIDTGTIARILRHMNEPAEIERSHRFYRKVLLIGAGDEQPGVDLATGWYRRNFAICANLLQNTKPGDRVVVVYGAGHAFLLRQCIQETPGFRLVEPNDWLP